MAGTDQLAIVELGVADAPVGLALSTEAHWNQNEADWRFFLTHGPVVGVRDHHGDLIATAALLPYSSGNAWISMVLVTAAWRRRGLATRLIDQCLATAEYRGLTPWLDATPAGAAVYGPLGFKPTIPLLRLRLEGASPRKRSPPLSSSANLNELVLRDRSIMGFGRSTLLEELSGRAGSKLVSHDDAMALVRDGRKNRHIGPLFASNSGSALALVDHIIGPDTGPWLIDAVGTRQEFLEGLTGSGWTIERPFQRMRFGSATALPNELSKQLPFAVVGPEYG
ncbi:MAG: N-acetyltransferase [Bradyrhizobium sp.]|uniref:GNAT family N-acetyltransferase n=1 Tax=Bradyrhizobium sp. TaxID=376 RepID=UPI0011F4B06E|nr:GNAT family N-acetyltransferase [Bradyrhizobium sp.]THD60679.1 MAG: N-acetyltransferase [Bradyrhizobium sp.]